MNNQNVNNQNRIEKKLAEVTAEQLRTIEGGTAAVAAQFKLKLSHYPAPAQVGGKIRISSYA